MIDALLAAAPAPARALRVAPGDDAAVLHDGTTLSVDTLVEGIHWNHRLSPADVGYKSVAVSVSDIAAMGVRPTWLLLALSLPEPLDHEWVAAFARGVADACRTFGVSLVGGDTTRSPGARMVSTTVGGRSEHAVVRRSGASAGDRIWIAGRTGLAAAGWALPHPPPESLAALRRPEPPVELALDLAANGVASSMMDLSDGIATDLRRLCRASGLGALVRPERLPVPAPLAGEPLAESILWAGGDDYSLLFTAADTDTAQVVELTEQHGVPAWDIGVLTDSRVLNFGCRAWPTPLWQHFGAAR